MGEASPIGPWEAEPSRKPGVWKMPEGRHAGQELLNVCSPAAIPSSDPMAACRDMSGEESRRATRKMPPVHGLSQP